MYRTDEELTYSPSDLITFMTSPFASWMNRFKLECPEYEIQQDPEDPLMKLLQGKGYQHEEDFILKLRDEGLQVLEIEEKGKQAQLKATLNAMKDGVEVICQGYLSMPPFSGYSDFLVKVSGKSNFGDYHYEVWDAKLSKSLKPYFAIQLCCYAEMLENIQGRRPEFIVVVLGDEKKEWLRTVDYFNYYLNLKNAFINQQNKFHPDDMPDPANSKELGLWKGHAETLFKEKDHLIRVANITRNQIKALNKMGIETMTELAITKHDKVRRISDLVFQKLKNQAAIQLKSEDKEKPDFKIIVPTAGEGIGLSLLPPSSPLDIFFDIEGFALVEGGLEYLWGNTYFNKNGNKLFKDFWAHDQEQEKQAFSDFIHWVHSLWKKDSTMHVYHYAQYEISVIRRLMGRYGVCEKEVDDLLRNEVFIDLYKIVRHGLLLGEQSYSIKNVEHLYREKRTTDVGTGSDSIAVYAKWKSNPDGETWQTSKILNSIRDYNIDDCESTQELVDWLRNQQKVHKIKYTGLTEIKEDNITEKITERLHLQDDILLKSSEEECPDRSRLLQTLAWLLEFHSRENKPMWWRLFDRKGLPDTELVDDMDCLAFARRTTTAPFLPTPRARNHAYEYSYDTEQPFRGTSKQYYVHGEDNSKTSVVTLSPKDGLITLQNKEPLLETISLIPDDYVQAGSIPEAIEFVVRNFLETNFSQCAIVDFLLRSRPRISGNSSGPVISNDKKPLSDTIDTVLKLENSTLCIQGPPGSGKTYTAKHIIAELLKQGYRVGITSNSHKAINNLLEGVADTIRDEDIKASLLKVDGNDSDPLYERPDITLLKTGKAAIGMIHEATCLGGTAWVFSREEMRKDFDYLFVDEAGQVSIANLVAVSASTHNLVIMGDQMQLGQPIQGTHPGDSGMSILEYYLQDHATIPKDLGVFLPTTYRMHPDVCRFISENVYEGRLHPAPITENRSIDLKSPSQLVKKSSGICFIPVEHEGNSQASLEEVKVIQSLADKILGSTFHTADPICPTKVIDWQDILFIAPFNYQVNQLKAVLGDQARVGSVDKFQGQEAPVVILSMCASSGDEVPRGIDFLFSKNRLNVAISRAQCLAIVVGNPELANIPVNNLKQMELVNFYCGIVNNK